MRLIAKDPYHSAYVIFDGYGKQLAFYSCPYRNRLLVWLWFKYIVRKAWKEIEQ